MTFELFWFSTVLCCVWTSTWLVVLMWTLHRTVPQDLKLKTPGRNRFSCLLYILTVGFTKFYTNPCPLSWKRCFSSVSVFSVWASHHSTPRVKGMFYTFVCVTSIGSPVQQQKYRVTLLWFGLLNFLDFLWKERAEENFYISALNFRSYEYKRVNAAAVWQQ